MLFDSSNRRIESYEADVLNTAFINMQKRVGRRMPPPLKSFDGIVGVKELPVFWGVIKVLRRLKKEKKNKKILFEKLFEPVNTKAELISVFLAVLELMRVGRVHLSEEKDLLWIRLSC